jgi:serine protease Do
MDVKRCLLAIVLAAMTAPAAYAQTRDSDRQPSEKGRLQMPQMGRVSMIGVRLEDVTTENIATYKLARPEGAIVAAVNPNSPAATAGLREKDLITAFDGERVRSAAHLTRLVQETPAGRDVMVQVLRDGRRTEVHIKPEAGRPWFDPRFGEVLDIVRQGVGEGTVNRSRSRLGVNVQALDGELAAYFGVKNGLLVTSVRPDTPAAKAGLRVGDVITAVDGKPVALVHELMAALSEGGSSKDVSLTVVREKKETALRATF